MSEPYEIHVVYCSEHGLIDMNTVKDIADRMASDHRVSSHYNTTKDRCCVISYVKAKHVG